MRTPGEELRDPTLAFHTLTTSLLNSEDAVLCLVRKTIHLSPLYLFLPYSVVRPIRINNLALGQLEKAFKIKCVHLGWGREGPPSWSHFSRWPLNISGQDSFSSVVFYGILSGSDEKILLFNHYYIF